MWLFLTLVLVLDQVAHLLVLWLISTRDMTICQFSPLKFVGLIIWRRKIKTHFTGSVKFYSLEINVWVNIPILILIFNRLFMIAYFLDCKQLSVVFIFVNIIFKDFLYPFSYRWEFKYRLNCWSIFCIVFERTFYSIFQILRIVRGERLFLLPALVFNKFFCCVSFERHRQRSQLVNWNTKGPNVILVRVSPFIQHLWAWIKWSSRNCWLESWLAFLGDIEVCKLELCLSQIKVLIFILYRVQVLILKRIRIFFNQLLARNVNQDICWLDISMHYMFFVYVLQS